MDYTADPELNTGKGLTLDKFCWDGSNLRQVMFEQILPSLRHMGFVVQK